MPPPGPSRPAAPLRIPRRSGRGAPRRSAPHRPAGRPLVPNLARPIQERRAPWATFSPLSSIQRPVRHLPTGQPHSAVRLHCRGAVGRGAGAGPAARDAPPGAGAADLRYACRLLGRHLREPGRGLSDAPAGRPSGRPARGRAPSRSPWQDRSKWRIRSVPRHHDVPRARRHSGQLPQGGPSSAATSVSSRCSPMPDQLSGLCIALLGGECPRRSLACRLETRSGPGQHELNGSSRRPRGRVSLHRTLRP